MPRAELVRRFFKLPSINTKEDENVAEEARKEENVDDEGIKDWDVGRFGWCDWP